MATKTLNALEDPEGTNRVIQKALAEANPMPEADPPSPTLVSLPGGLLAKDGEIISTAEVRELTGEDEEDLARAAQAKPGNIFHYMNTLLECGVKRFGTEDPRRTKTLLKNALVGDRDALIMGIRRATYGEDVDIEQWTCPSCGQKSDLTIPLEDVPVKEITREQLAPFTVDLRNGRSAEVRLATGADQLSIFE